MMPQEVDDNHRGHPARIIKSESNVIYCTDFDMKRSLFTSNSIADVYNLILSSLNIPELLKIFS